jgi:hypothetical protein
MSLSDTSIEERAIINSLAATRSLSAVAFRDAGNLLGALSVSCDAIGAYGPVQTGTQISRSAIAAQELIDRLTKSYSII